MSGSERAAVDLRLVPVAIAAWAGMYVATAASPALLTGGVAVAVAAGLFAARRRSWLLGGVAAVLFGCMLTGWARWAWSAHDPLVRLADERAVASATLVLQGAAHSGEREGVRPEWWLSAARLVAVDARGQTFEAAAPVEVSANGAAVAGWRALTPGTTVRATVRLDRAEPGDAVSVALRVREPPTVVAPPGPVDAAVERVRSGLRASVQHLQPEPRALVPALVVGDTSAMPGDLTDRFRVVGLTHLTAVSGANLTLLLAFLGTCARWAGVLGWWLRGLLGVGVVGFVVLCHAEPSVIRASAMGLVGLIALGAGGRGGQALRALCVAVTVIVFVDPAMARSAGFALSVLASGGIVAWSGPWTELLAQRVPRLLAEGVATPLAAQIATQPLVTALSGQVSIAGVAANLLAGPLVGPATVLGILAAITALPLPFVATGFGTAAGWCAQGLCWIARLGELFPGAAVNWPAGPAALVLVLAGCVGLALVMPRLLRHPWLVALGACVLLIALLRPPAPPGWPPKDWLVLFCDVGQGDATLLRSGPDEATLVDAGPDAARLGTCLREAGVRRVPMTVLTHFHADHITGLEVVVRGHGTERVIVSPVRAPQPGRRLVHQVAGRLPVTQVTAGSRLSVGQVQLDILAVLDAGQTAPADAEESSAENDGSLVMRATVGGLRVLLPGDVEPAGQRNALAAAADLSADVLLVPHHGSSRQLPEFLAATRARLAVFSAGAGNDYGHPATSTQRLVGELGMQVARTDQQGSVAVSRTSSGLAVTTQR